MRKLLRSAKDADPPSICSIATFKCSRSDLPGRSGLQGQFTSEPRSESLRTSLAQPHRHDAGELTAGADFAGEGCRRKGRSGVQTHRGFAWIKDQGDGSGGVGQGEGEPGRDGSAEEVERVS